MAETSRFGLLYMNLFTSKKRAETNKDSSNKDTDKTRQRCNSTDHPVAGGSGGGLLTRWLRDWRVGREVAAPAGGATAEAVAPPAVSITRSQSTYLTEGRGQRRKKHKDFRRYSFNEQRISPILQRKRIQTNGASTKSKYNKPPNSVPRDDSKANSTMMPSRSTPNLQSNTSTKAIYAYYQTNLQREDESPPAPPVRDSSSLKGVKYGPGHEKFPSWPVPTAAETPAALRAPPSGGSHRSKSWTDHTNYPKEKVMTYSRPHMKRQHSTQTQQKLKTVMERCEKLPLEMFDSRYEKINNERLYLPHVDRDGKQLGDMDYMVPSPPERDICKPQLTQADLEEYARSYQDPEPISPYTHETGLEDFIKYARNYEESLFPHMTHKSDLMHLHQKQLSYAQSEGYHSYVSSNDSTSTPFMDRLRRDSEAVPGARWGEDSANRGRDSVVTTSSGSASSSETLKWHGSMSDVSVASSSCTQSGGSKQLIAHSARVQTPQRHHSESVLYMAANELLGGELAGVWKDKEARNNNANKLKLFPVNTYQVQEQPNTNNRSVAERINELEKQQKYSYLDPEKRHKIPDPTLKAIQKKALLSFYERHQTAKTNWRSEPQLLQNPQQTIPQPPPRIKTQLPSRRASSASDYASTNPSKRNSIASIQREAKVEKIITSRHQHSNSCGSLSGELLLGPIIIGPSISLDDWVKPPERPPKHPHLRAAYPDLFHDQRVPSPDLPPPSPPNVLEDEVFQNDEPLPPPPTDLETSDWQHEFEERLKENTTKHQFASPQVETPNNYMNAASEENPPIINLTVGIPERNNIKYSSMRAREIKYTQRYPALNKLALNGNVAISQKVMHGSDQYRAEPLRTQTITTSTSATTRIVTNGVNCVTDGRLVSQRSSMAEGGVREAAPPPLQPRQMRINQSMRARIPDTRPGGVSLRISPAKEAENNVQKDSRPLSYSMSQSKASYLASRRERERIVPDSDTGSYKRTISPNGHVIGSNDTFDASARNNSRETVWPLVKNNNNNYNNNTKDATLINNNNATNILRRASMNDKLKLDKEEKHALVLPDVVLPPQSAKPRYLNRPSQLSLAPICVDNDLISKASPNISPNLRISPQNPPITRRSSLRTSPPSIRPTLSPTKRNATPTKPITSTPLRANFINAPITPTQTPKHTPPHTPMRTPTQTPQHTPSHTPTHTPTHTPQHTPPRTPPYISPPTSPKEPIVLESLQMIQRSEITMRVNACTTDAASQTDKQPATPLPTRKKLQEEIECEKLSEDIVNHLPTSDRLIGILVQGPDYKKPTDYVTGLFKIDVTLRPRPANSPFRSRTNTPSNSPPPTTPTLNTTATNTSNNSDLSSAVPNLEPVSPLSATSTYFTTSEPKARFLTRFSQDMSHINIVKDTKDLSQKKEQLVCRLDRKLEVLRGEQVVVSEECSINDELGQMVESHVAQLARPLEASKFRLHVQEVGKITSLLLGLSGRLARAENALMSMPEEHMERRILETKRDKLLEQLDEAKKLKESIDKRSVSVSNILYKYLNSEEYADYDHFINMKAKLIMDSKEISDKIKLGEEQLIALKETLIIT